MLSAALAGLVACALIAGVTTSTGDALFFGGLKSQRGLQATDGNMTGTGSPTITEYEYEGNWTNSTGNATWSPTWYNQTYSPTTLNGTEYEASLTDGTSGPTTTGSPTTVEYEYEGNVTLSPTLFNQTYNATWSPTWFNATNATLSPAEYEGAATPTPSLATGSPASGGLRAYTGQNGHLRRRAHHP
jgi:hypothetical protein